MDIATQDGPVTDPRCSVEAGAEVEVEAIGGALGPGMVAAWALVGADIPPPGEKGMHQDQTCLIH